MAWSIPLENPSTKISMQFSSSEPGVGAQSWLEHCALYPLRTVTKVALAGGFSGCITPRESLPADDDPGRGKTREILTGCVAPLSSLPMGLGSSAGSYKSTMSRSIGAGRGSGGSICGGAGRGSPLLSRRGFLPPIGGRRCPTSEGVVGVL